MIKISDTAAKQIAVSLEQMGDSQPPLRVAIKVMPDGSFHYNMGFDDQKHESDKNFTEKEINLVIDASSMPLITGMTIDYVDIDGKHEIVFLNPNDPNYKPPTEG